MRRPRSDSTLEALTEEQKQQLCEWMLSHGLPYRVIKKMVAKEFGVETITQSLSRFYHSYCIPELLRRRSEVVAATDEFGKQLKRKPGLWDKTTIDAIKQKSFELAIAPGVKPVELRQLYSIILKSRDQDLTERKLKMLEAAERKANEAEAITRNTGLSVEEKVRRMKDVFGML